MKNKFNLLLSALFFSASSVVGTRDFATQVNFPIDVSTVKHSDVTVDLGHYFGFYRTDNTVYTVYTVYTQTPISPELVYFFKVYNKEFLNSLSKIRGYLLIDFAEKLFQYEQSLKKRELIMRNLVLYCFEKYPNLFRFDYFIKFKSYFNSPEKMIKFIKKIGKKINFSRFVSYFELNLDQAEKIMYKPIFDKSIIDTALQFSCLVNLVSLDTITIISQLGLIDFNAKIGAYGVVLGEGIIYHLLKKYSFKDIKGFLGVISDKFVIEPNSIFIRIIKEIKRVLVFKEIEFLQDSSNLIEEFNSFISKFNFNNDFKQLIIKRFDEILIVAPNQKNEIDYYYMYPILKVKYGFDEEKFLIRYFSVVYESVRKRYDISVLVLEFLGIEAFYPSNNDQECYNQECYIRKFFLEHVTKLNRTKLIDRI